MQYEIYKSEDVLHMKCRFYKGQNVESQFFSFYFFRKQIFIKFSLILKSTNLQKLLCDSISTFLSIRK